MGKKPKTNSVNRHVSTSQTAAEKEMIAAIGEQLRVSVKEMTLELDDDTIVQIDGYYEQEDRRVLVEAFARTKELKSGQKRKILADILKLIFVAETLLSQNPKLVIEKYLFFQSEEAAKLFKGNAWAAKACLHFKVKVLVQQASENTFRQVQQAELVQGWRDGV